MFTHLHLHSHYSLLQALHEPKAYISKAKEMGMESIALTDYNGFYGAIEHYKYCKKFGIKPILGVELALVQDYRIKQKDESFTNIIVLAKNNNGYKNLLKLISHANLEGWHARARVDIALLQDYYKDCYCLIGGKLSLIGAMQQQAQQESFYKEILQSLVNIFGSESMIFECIVGDEQKDPNIRIINTITQSLAEEYNSFLTCSPNVHMLNENDAYSYEVFLCIKAGKRIFDSDRPKITQPLRMMSESEVRDRLIKQHYTAELIERMITNTNLIADSIDIDLQLGKAMFPNYQTSSEVTIQYKDYQQQYG